MVFAVNETVTNFIGQGIMAPSIVLIGLGVVAIAATAFVAYLAKKQSN